MSKLIIVRGLPGSGKSVLAKKIAGEFSYRHYEADMFFVDRDGNYNFNPANRAEAHTWCQRLTYESLKHKQSVVVSNSFTQIWEMDVYLMIAEALQVEVEIVEMSTMYKNIHNVPEHILEKMKDNWQEFPTEHTFYHVPRVIDSKQMYEEIFKQTMAEQQREIIEAGG